MNYCHYLYLDKLNSVISNFNLENILLIYCISTLIECENKTKKCINFEPFFTVVIVRINDL